jgi:hypothetical protein
MKKQLYTTICLVFIIHSIQAQIRNHRTKYVELSGGIPLILSNNSFLQHWKDGERIYGLGLCFTNAKSNYHRIGLHHREEMVENSPAYFTNLTFKYSYESTLLKSKYHLSYLGLVYGAGVGIETLRNSPNDNVPKEIAYPLLTVGLQFERFLGPQFAFFSRLDTDLTTSNISQRLKANAQIGLKFKLSNGL